MRERILNIAFKHFTKYSYAKTTMTGIASELGVQKSAIYYYFKNKEAILQAIIHIEAANLLDSISKTFQNKTTAEQAIQSYIEERIRAMHFVSERYKKLKEELFMLLPHIELIRAPFLMQEIGLVVECLKDGMDKGEFQIEFPKETASALVHALKGLEIPMYVSEQVPYNSKEIRSLTSLFINGLKSNKS